MAELSGLPLADASPLHRFQTDPRLSGDIWLVVGGGVLMISGLLVILLN
jgi:hypothetical protein